MTFVFDYFTIAYIIIALIYLFVGIYRGFFPSLISLVSNVFFLFGAFLLCKPLANWIMTLGNLKDQVYNTVYNYICQQSPYATITIQTAQQMDMILPEVYSKLHIPSFIQGPISRYIQNMFASGLGGQEAAVYIANPLTFLFFYAVTFVGLIVIFYLILLILHVIFRKQLKSFKRTPLSRILGGTVNILNAIILIVEISFVLVNLHSNSTFTEFIDRNLWLNDPNAFTISKWFYENNFLNMIIGYFF
ncbi:MAG: hypothetical protein K5694_04665 [Bacilli bacterium]|nr:hypothetical protein [Bacilli bacterium]